MLLKHLFKTAAAVIILSFIITGCDIKPGTMGQQNRIFVVVDSVLWQDLGEQTAQGFERIIYTPHTEKTFSITPVTLDRLSGLKHRMNVFFMGISDEEGEVNNYIKSMMPDNFKDGVETGEYFYLFQQDLFARSQINLILYSKNRDTFKEQFSNTIDKIYKTFNTKYYARLEESMFERDEQDKLSDFLQEYFGWNLRLQHDYFKATHNLDTRYVWMRRMNPDRSISIWEVKADQEKFNLESIKAVRTKMAEQYYSKDVIEDEDLYLEDVDFNGQPAQKLTGLWRNDSLLVGGPFRTYAVHDPLKSVYYMIDISVLAPGKLKKPFLDQLEVIAHTFEVVKD